MLSTNLKRLMLDRALTPEALSVQLSKDHDMRVAAGTISAWMRGTRTPSVSTLICVARTLDTSLDALLVRDVQAAV